MKSRTKKIWYLGGLLILTLALLTTRAYFVARSSDADNLVKQLEPNKKYIRHSHFGILTGISYLPHWTIYYSEIKADETKCIFGIYEGIFGDFGAFGSSTGPKFTEKDPEKN